MVIFLAVNIYIERNKDFIKSFCRIIDRLLITLHLFGSVHDCTSSTFLIAWSGHRCTVILAVPRGEYEVNTLAGGRVPIAVSIGARM